MATVNEKMTAIADAIRGNTDIEGKLTLDDMASGIDAVYNKGDEDGYQSGIEEGKLVERNAFWEVFQQGGNRTYHMYTFYGVFWNDDNFNPIYPIKLSNNNANAFYQCGATDSKVVIDIGAVDLNNTFRYAKFVTMKINIVEGANVKSAFTSMPALKNLSVTGTIGKSFDISDSPLTVESLKGIVTTLKDYSIESPFTYTLTLKDSCKEELEADTETVEFNGENYTYFELITAKGWNLA